MRPSALPLPLRLAVFLSAVAILLWLSLAPSDELPPVTFWDKGKHALAYVVLTGLGLLLFPGGIWRLVIGVFALGVAIEVAQALMDLGRQGDWHDVLADSLGILIAVMVQAAVPQKHQN